MSNVDDFKKMVSGAGIPTESSALKQQWEAIAQAENVPFSNNSDYSPLWRLIGALVTTPVLWLVNFLITHLLPNSFIKTATGAYLDILAWGVNTDRKAATKATGELEFSRSETAGALTIPVGTEVRSSAISGVVQALVTTQAAILADGQTNVRVPVAAVTAGQDANLPAGYYNVMPEPVPGIDSVSNPANWLNTPGADKESDADLRLRCRNQFTALNQYHTDAVYLSMITAFEGIEVRNVYFEHGAPRGPGTANAYIMLDVGIPSAGFLLSIEQSIMDVGNHGHGDDLRVYAMPTTTHDLLADLWPVPNLTAEEETTLTIQVEQFIRAAFRENGDYSPTQAQPFDRFSFSRLAQELHEEFPDLASVEFDLDDIVTELNVPALNSLTVTLNG